MVCGPRFRDGTRVRKEPRSLSSKASSSATCQDWGSRSADREGGEPGEGATLSVAGMHPCWAGKAQLCSPSCEWRLPHSRCEEGCWSFRWCMGGVRKWVSSASMHG